MLLTQKRVVGIFFPAGTTVHRYIFANIWYTLGMSKLKDGTGLPERPAPTGDTRAPTEPSPLSTPTATSKSDFEVAEEPPTSEVTVPRTSVPLQEHQKHTLARAAVAGLPLHEIGAMLRHTPRYVKKVLEEDTHVRELVDYYSGQVVRTMVDYKFAMMERMDKAILALDEGLDAPDLKLRIDVSKFVIGQVVPKQADRLSVELGVKGVDPEDHKVIADAVGEIAKHVGNLRKFQTDGEIGDFRKHLIEGELPGPADVQGHESRSPNTAASDKSH